MPLSAPAGIASMMSARPVMAERSAAERFPVKGRMAAVEVRLDTEREMAGIVATGAAAGSDYAWLDVAAPAAGVVYYWLEEVDTSGAVTEYGPAVTGVASGLSGMRHQSAR